MGRINARRNSDISVFLSYSTVKKDAKCSSLCLNMHLVLDILVVLFVNCWRLWPCLRNCPCVYLEGLRKTAEKADQNSQRPGRGLNGVSTEYKAEFLSN